MPDFPDRPGYNFDPGPPPEVATFFRNKGLAPSFDFRDVEPEEHAVAFAVAKMAKADMLAAAKAEVQRAIDDGMTFEAFKRSWRGNPALADWWGRKTETDPVTGEARVVQLGSHRRLRTIYRANLRSARAAGQWERIERTKRALPFLQYRLGPSERHRPHHASKEGLVLPVDDPFWDAWMPPNGWGCKCWVVQLTRTRAEAEGISTAPAPDTREYVNPRTGESRDVPVGLDPSWDRNPGKRRVRAMEALLDGRLSEAPEPEARAALRDIAASWMVRRVLAGRAGGRVSVGLMAPEIGEAVGNGARFVKITDEYGAKVGAKAAPVTPEVMARVSDAIAEGPVAWDRREGRNDLLVFVPGDEPWQAVLKNIPQAGELWIRTIHRYETRRWERDLMREGIELLRK